MVFEERGYLPTRLNSCGILVGNLLNSLTIGVLPAAPFQAQRRAILATLSFYTPCMRLPFSAVGDFLPQMLAASGQLTDFVSE